jgi:hypothetical protein
MSRRYTATRQDGPSEVEVTDAGPRSFRWRGRRYVVREVLGQWVAADVWWRPLWSAGERRADRVRTDLAPGDRQVWRLEVDSDGGRGVVDISRASDGRWVLSAVWD